MEWQAALVFYASPQRFSSCQLRTTPSPDRCAYQQGPAVKPAPLIRAISAALAGPSRPKAIEPGWRARELPELPAAGGEGQEAEYREAPMYSPMFAQWIQGRGDMSGALEQYIEGRYPSLKAEFQAGVGRLPYSETREGAIGEAGQREQQWQSWLSERMPETRQEYYGQRPTERGERMYMYQPTTRAVNW